MIESTAGEPVQVDCCYCMGTQYVPKPPVIVDCKRCGKRFCVMYDRRNVIDSRLELSEEAKTFFRHQPSRLA